MAATRRRRPSEGSDPVCTGCGSALVVDHRPEFAPGLVCITCRARYPLPGDAAAERAATAVAAASAAGDRSTVVALTAEAAGRVPTNLMLCHGCWSWWDGDTDGCSCTCPAELEDWSHVVVGQVVGVEVSRG